MSYSGGCRIAPSESSPRLSDASHQGSTQPGLGLFPRPPRQQLVKPFNYTPRGSRASSFSSAEDLGHIAAPVYRQSANRTKRLSMLPRLSGGGPTHPISSASTANSFPSSTSAQSIPTSISTPDITNPSAFVPSPPAAPVKKTRNVLRRKAATIGKRTEQDSSLKLSLVIPDPAQRTEVKNLGLCISSESQSVEALTSSFVIDGTERKEEEHIQNNGPEELASLRTTIDPQAIPAPPTPFFPSASTPSTRCSGSPGMWSRGSTPTTISSYSPGIVQPVKVGRLRQPSPCQTRLPVFSPPSPHTSPHNAQSDRSEPKVQQYIIAQRVADRKSNAKANSSKLPSLKSTSIKITGPPHSPPPRKSSMNFSPSKNSDIDVEKARKEVEEAEREVFNSQRYEAATSTSEANAPKTPPRPSRHGTQPLEFETSPVIQSNLPHLKSTGHTRRASIERARARGGSHPIMNHSAAASVDSALGDKDSSRLPSVEAGPHPTARKSTRIPMHGTSKERTDLDKRISPKRFGIFHKRSKPEPETNAGELARSARKGPAAGTGHEGYGRYSQRGRKTSASSSSGTRTRSTSTTRSASQSFSSSKGSSLSRQNPDLDEFLMSRLEPVVISGGGGEGSTLSRTQSEQSMSSVSVASSNIPQRTPFTPSTVQSTDSLATSTGSFLETSPSGEVQPFSGPQQSKSPERKTATSDRPALKSRMPIPKGKKHGFFFHPDATKSRTSLSNRNSSIETERPPPGVPSLPNQSQEPTKADRNEVKKGKASRWNLFQWHRHDEPKTTPTPAPPYHTAQLHAAISPVPNTRPVAHYEIVDTDSEELDEIMKNIETSPPTEEEEDKEEEGMVILPAEIPPALNIRKTQTSALPPSSPVAPSGIERNSGPPPKTAVSSTKILDLESEHTPDDRPGRLASVGRIPQVVSRRDRQHRLAMASFSRPFSVSEYPSLTATASDGSSTTKQSSSKQPIENPFSQPPHWKIDIGQTSGANEQVSALDFLAGPYSANEFIHFSPQKGSPSSSSSGALAAVTAVLPKPDTIPTEDEVWNEYDDLLDHVLSPEKSNVDNSNRFGHDDRFELATMASRALQDELNNSDLLEPSLNMNRSSADSIRLRRSRIVSALHSAPSTQPSYSDIIAAYGDMEDNDSITEQMDTAPVSSDQVQERQSSFLQSLAAEPTTKRKSSDDRKATPVPSEREWDAVTRTNMRSASLMTSRWLSFGRVLFSPAQNHVKAGSHGRILVIDGLGNDDWSFYCSLTYPDAEVYSLSGRPVSTALPHPAAWQPPTNHHTVYHAGLQNPLPFPKDYFTVAVLRFPAASSEAVRGNIIQECKRVLRSGGYLELSLLDRDMVNMGAHTRKSVRQLKEMTCLAHSSISLSPASDSMQRLLGTQGFDNLRRCMVRIPVAGMVVRSSGSTTSSSNKSISASATMPSNVFSIPRISLTAATESGTTTPRKTPPSDDNVSLGDLLSDPSPSAANDESIAKIVARVGRWWYTKCYEDLVLDDTGATNSSIWNDRKVLRECQKRGTGFRMLIAYAQKPSEVKRRTASV